MLDEMSRELQERGSVRERPKGNRVMRPVGQRADRYGLIFGMMLVIRHGALFSLSGTVLSIHPFFY